MLVLSRKRDEVIKIGDSITITVIKIGPNSVRLGIEAPKGMQILRIGPDGQIQTGPLAPGEDEQPPLIVEIPLDPDLPGGTTEQ